MGSGQAASSRDCLRLDGRHETVVCVAKHACLEKSLQRKLWKLCFSNPSQVLRCKRWWWCFYMVSYRTKGSLYSTVLLLLCSTYSYRTPYIRTSLCMYGYIPGIFSRVQQYSVCCACRLLSGAGGGFLVAGMYHIASIVLHISICVMF